MTQNLFKREYKRYNAKEKLALSGPPFWIQLETKESIT